MLLIDDAIVVTLNDDHDVFFDGAVAIDGDRIVAIGSSGDVRARVPEGTTVLDAQGGAVMPGLVDLHYHTALGRGWADHLPLAENLQRFWAFHVTTSLGFDIPRAIGNAALVLIAGHPVLAALRRAARRASFGAVAEFVGPPAR